MTSSKDLHNSRLNYTKSELIETNISTNPFAQFGTWLDTALTVMQEPNAMILSTVASSGVPSSRVVLLKAFNANGFVFYTNYLSRKGNEIAANNKAALLFFWDALEQQVRIEGTLEKTDAQQSESYFLSRPYESQLSAIVSPQSQEISSRSYLEDKLEALKNTDGLKCPENWGGYILKPTYFEFWQGRANRLHDRIVYEELDGNWNIKRLAP